MQNTQVQNETARPPEASGLLDTARTAAYLGLDVGTLRKWRCRREGPPWHRLGKAVRYRQSDVDAWLATRRVTA